MNEPIRSAPEPSCDVVSMRLPDLLAGELAESDARAVELHLGRCARCARERADLEALTRLFARDAIAPPTEVAQARLRLRRELEHARSNRDETPARIAAISWSARLLHSRLPQAIGFALLLALFVPIFPRLHRSLAPVAGSNVAATFAHEARELVASVGTWFPALPEWSLPPPAPESLKAWFGALHSDAH